MEARDLGPGTYDVLVAGISRATMTVWANSPNGESEVKFRAVPRRNTDLPLTFDPRGSLVQIAKSGTVYLSAVLP